jgi:O-antigen ligase
MRYSPHWGLLLGILVYELLIGSAASCLHPAIGLLLAGAPFLLLALVSKPSWAYGLFIISIQFSNISFAQLGPYNVRVVDIGFFLMLAVFIVHALVEDEFRVPKTGIDVPLWIFLAWVFLSFTWSLNRSTGTEALIKIAIGVLTFYLTICLIPRRSHLNIAINVWILAGLISALAAIYEFRTVAHPHIAPDMTKWATPIRSQGYYGGPIMLGSFLTLAIFINYVQILNATSPLKRILFLMSCVLMIIGLLTTLSRNDIAAWIIATGFFTYRFKRMRLPTVGVIVVLFLLGLALTGGELFSVFWHRFFYVFEGLEVSSPMRVAVWRLALETIAEHPLIGAGLGGFTAIATEQLRHGLIYPHSLILYVLVDLGLVGFVCVAYFGARIFRFVRRVEKGLSTESDKAIATAMTAGLIIHVFWALAQNITFQHIIFWAFLGISFASYHVLGKAAQESGVAKRVR